MAKRKRRPVPSKPARRFYSAFWIMAAAIIVILTMIYLNPQKRIDQNSLHPADAAPRRKNFPPVSKEDERRAIDYATNVINPILIKHATDPKELPAIRNRILEFSRQNQAGTLGYQMQPVRSPWEPTTVAKTQYNDSVTKRVIMGFAPQMQEDEAEFRAQGKAQYFEDYVVLTFAHEMIHVELMEANSITDQQTRLGWPDRNLMLQDEAMAWGITILEILRPMASQGRWVPKTMANASNWLKELHDNYRDPAWVAGFNKYHPL